MLHQPVHLRTKVFRQYYPWSPVWARRAPIANMVVHQDGNHHRGGTVRSDARRSKQCEYHDAGTGDGGNGTIHNLRGLRAAAKVGKFIAICCTQ